VAASAHKLPLLSNPSLTYFAPAGRDDRDEIRRKATLVRETEWIKRVLDAMPNMAMILNSNRQIVAANELLLRTLNVATSQIIEERPGEAVGCIRAKDGPDGCGTSHHCANCGAVNAILGSQGQGKTTVRESRILIDTADGLAQLDLKVTATPLQVGADRLTLIVLEDISQAKRLALLQRLFFHDVLNIAGCIRGYAEILADGATDASLCGDVARLVDQLVEEIHAHRDLVYAESGDLDIQPTPVQVFQTLDDLKLQYARHPAAEGREIKLENVWNGMITTDRRLLLRVLGNMIKNALEATSPGRAVTLGCTDGGNGTTFTVHNTEVMPEDVQLQVFQRSFSTKAQSGRGIGTYSMKLFGERYLGGKVEFTSRSPEGTTFSLTLPK